MLNHTQLTFNKFNEQVWEGGSMSQCNQIMMCFSEHLISLAWRWFSGDSRRLKSQLYTPGARICYTRLKGVSSVR